MTVKLVSLPLLAAVLMAAGCATQTSSSTVAGGVPSPGPAPTVAKSPAVAPGTSAAEAPQTSAASDPAAGVKTAPTGTVAELPGPASAGTPKRETPAPKAQSSDWRPSSMGAVEVARKADGAILNSPGLLSNCYYDGEIPGGRCTGVIDSKTRDPKHFSFYYIVVTGKPKGRRHRVIRFGSEMSIQDDQGWRTLDPTDPLFNESGEQIVKDWPLNFQRLMFASLVNGKAGFAPYVEALTKGVGGYAVRCDERTVTADGKEYPQVRIFAERTPTAAKTLGTSTVEMIFSRTLWLPITMRITNEVPGQKTIDIGWKGTWSGPWGGAPGKPAFEDKWFIRPKG